MKKEDPKLIEEEYSDKTLHNQKSQSHGMVAAFLLIIIGSLFLLNNFGLLPWSVWADLWRFWPLFLIFWGFQMIFGRSKLANILILIISLLIVAYCITKSIAYNNPQLNEYLKQKFPIWQHLYRYSPPAEDNTQLEEDDDEDIEREETRRPILRRPPTINFGPDQDYDFP